MIFWFRAGPTAWKLTSTVCPVAFSKPAASARTPDAVAWLRKIVMSAASAGGAFQVASATTRLSIMALAAGFTGILRVCFWVMSNHFSCGVMAGLVPAIHALLAEGR